MSNLFDLSEKVAIVTGGNGVLGGAIASGLAASGVKVGVLGRTASTVTKKVSEIRSKGGEAIELVADVLEHQQLEMVHQKVLNEWGKLDILLNVAGGNLSGATIGPDQNFFDLSLEDFDRVVDINLKGTVLPTYVFAKQMAQQGKGCIINISSLTAAQPFTRVVGYSAAKAGIDNFTKWLSVEMIEKYGPGIRVNAIAPGVFIGKQNERLLLNEDNQLTPRGNTIIEHTPMRRFGNPDELVGTVIYLCSEAASFVTGIVITVDGGFSAFSGV